MKAVDQAFSYRNDPLVPSFPDDRPILIFDGKCALCSGFARFILRQDRAHCFRFMTAQTPTGAALVAALAESYGPLPRMTLSGTGYGAGGRDLEAFPNVVRVILGTEAATGAPA